MADAGGVSRLTHRLRHRKASADAASLDRQNGETIAWGRAVAKDQTVKVVGSAARGQVGSEM